jgi:hypothetical protein
MVAVLFYFFFDPLFFIPIQSKDPSPPDVIPAKRAINKDSSNRA